MDPKQAKRDIIYNYMDLAGMVTVDRNPTPESTKNGLMHLGLYLCYLKALNLLDYYDVEAFYDCVESCEEVPGCYDRYPAYNDKPRSDDANAHDDASGVFAGSVVSDLRFHKDILDHGIKHAFVYNNQTPGVFVDDTNPINWEWWAFRLRFIDHILWYFLGNNRVRALSPLLMAWLAFKTINTKAGSGRLIDYMMVESLATDSYIWKKFRNWLVKRCKLSESTNDYFKEQNGVTHPLVFMAKEIEKS